eukprot:evm.model.scf_1923.3 EVM.evm.TU.scf_1923.3   scf_1923:11703-11855(+)
MAKTKSSTLRAARSSKGCPAAQPGPKDPKRKAGGVDRRGAAARAGTNSAEE